MSKVKTNNITNQSPQTNHNLINSSDIEQLAKWNHTQTDFPLDKTVIDLFEQQVRDFPDKKVILFEDKSISYQELNTYTNRLAHHLIQSEIKPETLIGVYIERSLEMVICLLAILKAGAAYVPLDPEYPSERLQYILDDADISILLTQEKLELLLPTFKGKKIIVESGSNLFEDQPDSNPNIAIQTNQLAYAIYTSGSTGKPKGVAIEHYSLTNFLLAMNQTLNISDKDHVLAITRITFDIAALELFLPLISGASIRLSNYEESHSDIKYDSRLAKDRLTLIQTTPSTWQMLTQVQ